MARRHKGSGRQVVEGRGGLPAWKRCLDYGLIALLSPAILLVGTVVGLLVRLGSAGPIFFRQKRVGYKGSQFTCYKFRTMRVDAETESHRRHLHELIQSRQPMTKLDAHRDPRLIPFGSVLRASGLDELPQLLNVLRGEMSLVGPRPCIPYECEKYQAWHWKRFDAVPGLTGLWQVSGKNHTTFEQMIQMDIDYSQRRNLWLDVRIIFKTLPALWGQYWEMRGFKSQESAPPSQALRKSVQSYNV